MKTPRAVTLRPARAHDARAIALLSRDLIENGLRWRYTPPCIAALIEDRETIALVACDGARIEGFAVMQFGDDDAHLMLLAVRDALQRRGIGRRLHDWLLASARVAGMAAIGLELRIDNEGALAFYRALGYAETHTVPRYYDERVDARRMTLRLRAT